MQLEGYSNISKFATGGMATVYKARQISLNRTVAIKVLSAESLWDDEAKTLFEQESLVIAQLTHPNIIHIIDRGVSNKGRPYFVMEYIQGSDLSQLMHREKLSLKAKLKLLMQICKGMEIAHKNGVIHRDIKPSNILVDANEHVHILDFGIAWLAASGKPENIVGTPDYMSPEQFSKPESVTYLSDIYSLGIIMYEMFTGQLPPGNRENMDTHLQSTPAPLAELILQCLMAEPEKRPASVDNVRLQILSITQGSHLDQLQKSEANTTINNSDNKFALLDVIKQDKYGAVYLFENRQNKSRMVIKKRNSSIAGYQEAKSLSEKKHPNIINIYGTSKNQKTFIIVMEYLTGGSLQDRLIRKHPLTEFFNIAESICSALEFAHNNNIAHGNLRPSNILFTDKKEIKLTDFGLDEHYSGDTKNSNWYMPNDTGCTARSKDIYSTGAIFYRMLTGKNVHFSNKRIQNNEAFGQLDKQLKKILCNMMEEDSIDHYHSFDQVLQDIIRLKTSLTSRESRKKTGLPVWLIISISVTIIIAIFLAINTLYPEYSKYFIRLFHIGN